MKPIIFPDSWVIEWLRQTHPRDKFSCGHETVDDWLRTKAWQSQKKQLSATKVLIDNQGQIVGYYTLSSGQIDFSELPPNEAKQLPRRQLPVAVLPWLGVNRQYHRQGLGERLLGQALRDCYVASKTFPFVAIVLDCVDDNAKTFYLTFDFQELPSHPFKLYLSAKALSAILKK
jgi:hypothetical protein